MSQVEFHTLAEESDVARLKCACALIERAWLEGGRVLVWLDDSEALTAFDNLLWTFGERAFVPHEMLAEDPAASEAPVQLTAALSLPPAAFDSGFTALFAMRAQPAAETLRFPRVVEVVDAEPRRRDAGRARFRFYREHGAAPQHFNVAPKA